MGGGAAGSLIGTHVPSHERRGVRFRSVPGESRELLPPAPSIYTCQISLPLPVILRRRLAEERVQPRNEGHGTKS